MASLSTNTKKIIKGILFTLLFLFVFRMGYWVILPFVNNTITQPVEFGFLNTLSGGALGHFSVLCLGISPYITSSIVIQLLQMDIVPALKEWSEEGEAGKQKLNQLTRYVALGLAFVQSLVLTIGIDVNYSGIYFVASDFVTDYKVFLFIYLSLVATAGTAFTLWLAELITTHGVGNGTSMIICAGILASIPGMIKDLVVNYISTEESRNVFIFVFTIVMLVLIVLFIVFMESAKRIIPVQYANRPATATFRGKNDSNIPIKLNSASVIPVIFASTLMSIPTTVVSLLGLTTKYESTSTAYKIGYWLNQIFSTTSSNSETSVVTINIIGFALYIILIIIFSFFYSFLQMNPDKMAENLQKQNAFIPGVRPGDETSSFISRVLFKITMIGATYLTIIAIIPIVFTAIFNLPSSVQVGGTSLIIVVGVAIETAKQIKASYQEKQYRGFMG